MKGVIEWFAHNPVAANLLMFVILISGLATLSFGVKEEVFPEFSLDMISISVAYPGAAPQEVEEAICIRIEEEIDGLDGIKKISSTASENFGSVMVEVFPGTDNRELLDDIKNRVDAIDTFPAEVEEPLVEEVTNRRQVISIAVYGDAEESSLKELGSQIRDEVAALDGISLTTLENVRPYEISIEVSEEAMRRHGITFAQVAEAVGRSSIDLPGGSIKTGGGEILLRTKGQAYRGQEFEEIVVVSRPDGARLRVGDVATVVDGFADDEQEARFDGQPSVLVQVYRVGDQGATFVANRVREFVEERQATMPTGISLTTWADNSEILKSRKDVLLRNGAGGAALVVILLALFLRATLAFWVTLGIPISFLGAAWFMPGLDVSINLISLFAFIVVLGIVVDDAIVVGENIYSKQTKGTPGLKGAILGAQEVSVPVIFAVLTTVAAFAPLLNVEGQTGKIMRVIPLIVIPTLLFSLVESLVILPAHLRHVSYREPRNAIGRGWRSFQSRIERGLHVFVDRVYRPVLDLALAHRYTTMAIGIATLLVTMGVVGGGKVRFTFFPPVEADFVIASLTMPQGTPADVTASAIARMEQTALDLQRQLSEDGGIDQFRHVSAVMGSKPLGAVRRPADGGGGGPSGSNIGEVTIELAPAEVRTVSSRDVVQQWRKATGSIPDATELTFTSSLFSPGDPINIQLNGADLGALRQAADKTKLKLAEYNTVTDIADSFREGKQEIEFSIRPEAEALGLTMQDLALQVRQGFYGAEIQNVQRGRDEVKVYVRYPAEERISLANLDNMRIRTRSGLEVPFGTVANAKIGRGFESISRVDRMRSVNVTADLDESQLSSGEVLQDMDKEFLPQLVADYGIRYSFEGQAAEQRETMAGLARGYMIALFVIYTLMAIPFKSYLQPIIVMSAIPFGLVGVIWGHAILGMNLTILSMFGTVALTGVVVNDSLVMVDRVNNLRRGGASLIDAVRESGASRFRPILLTSLTTFAGLTPLLLEKSVQAQFLIPMAVSLAYGVIFATVITLILVPAFYLVLEDFVSGWKKVSGSVKRLYAGADDTENVEAVAATRVE